MDFPGGSDGKASVYNAGDLGSIPGLGRFPGEGNGNPLQYPCLENPMDPRGERPLVELYLEPGVFSERCMEKLPLRVDFIHRVEFGEVSGKSGSYGMWNHPRGHVWNVFVRPASS